MSTPQKPPALEGRLDAPVRHCPPYRALLEKVLPLAVATTAEQRALLAEVAEQLGAAAAKAKARAAAHYKANAEKYKARARKQPNDPPEVRRARYAASAEHYRGKGREYAQRRRETGKAAAYAESLKISGRNREYQAKYKYGEFAEAALVLNDLERELKAKGTTK